MIPAFSACWANSTRIVVQVKPLADDTKEMLERERGGVSTAIMDTFSGSGERADDASFGLSIKDWGVTPMPAWQTEGCEALLEESELSLWWPDGGGEVHGLTGGVQQEAAERTIGDTEGHAVDARAVRKYDPLVAILPPALDRLLLSGGNDIRCWIVGRHRQRGFRRRRHDFVDCAAHHWHQQWGCACQFRRNHGFQL